MRLIYQARVASFAAAFLTSTFSIQADENAEVVTMHFDTKYDIEGSTEFDREKFINMHSSPQEAEWDSPELMDQFLNGWDVYMGREVGMTLEYLGQVKEDANKPGYPSVEHLKELGKQKRMDYDALKYAHPYESRTELVTSTHIHPFFPDGTKTEQGFAMKNADATATFLAHYFKEGFGDHGDGIHGEPTPKYFEVINEPVYEMIEKAGDKPISTHEEIFKYHNVIADKVRELNPEILIGGYCDASPDHEADGFDYWRKNWESFMKIAGKNMDFYSIHLYDKGWDRGMQYLKKGANVEAILDMLEHGSKVTIGEVKPFMISEYGAFDAIYYFDPYTKGRDWLNLKATSSMMLNFMDRPHLILKSIPFLILKANWWEHESGQVYPYRLLREEDGKWIYTELAKFYELWSNVKGTRVEIKSSDIDIQTDAYVSGDKAFVIVDNLEFNSQWVNLNIAESFGVPVKESVVKHLHQVSYTPRLDVTKHKGAVEGLRIGAESVAIIEYTFEKPVEFKSLIKEKKYYADRYLQKIEDTPLEFKIDGVKKSAKGQAVLRIGVGREHMKSLQPKVTVNGHELSVSRDVRGYDQTQRLTFFGVLEVPVPYEYLKQDNVISITFPDTGGHVSSLALQAATIDSL